MNKIPKILALLLILTLLCLPVSLAEDEVQILLSDDQITVNGEVLGEETLSGVRLQLRTEIHEDVPEDLEGLENRTVTITQSGTYRISGTAQDAQVRVEAGETDAVRLILDGADISCRTAPAIAVISAADPRQAGEYGVTIELAEGSASTVSGSHTEETETEEIKLSGAITSLVSVGFEGGGYLNVNGDNEGVEVKFGHMTFNGGNIMVLSGDDPLNASEDGVSVITVNAGTLHVRVNPVQGGEGDGVDSNGAIVINGGSISAYAHPESMDSGIDSDLGCTINGGIVLSAGNMYDEISAQSSQLFMALQFAEPVKEMIVVTDTDGKMVATVHMPEEGAYSSFVLSSPDVFVEGDYHLYLGGELTLEGETMIYTPGTQLQHGGFGGGRVSGGMGRGGMQPPNGIPGDMQMPEMPENMEMPEDMGQIPESKGQIPEGMGQIPEGMEQMPEGMREGFDPGRREQGKDSGAAEASSEASTVFHLAPGSTMFSNITAVE